MLSSPPHSLQSPQPLLSHQREEGLDGRWDGGGGGRQTEQPGDSHIARTVCILPLLRPAQLRWTSPSGLQTPGPSTPWIVVPGKALQWGWSPGRRPHWSSEAGWRQTPPGAGSPLAGPGPAPPPRVGTTVGLGGVQPIRAVSLRPPSRHPRCQRLCRILRSPCRVWCSCVGAGRLCSSGRTEGGGGLSEEP